MVVASPDDLVAAVSRDRRMAGYRVRRQGDGWIELEVLAQRAKSPVLLVLAWPDVWRDERALHVASRDPHAALAALRDREVRTVIVEGGATVLSAFLAAGVVDEVHAYLAPALLGGGLAATEGLGIDTMAKALRLERVTHLSLGADILVAGFVPQEG